MSETLQLVVMASLPIFASLILKLIFTSKTGQKLSYINQQIIAGIVLGLIAITGTEFGVPINGAVINARDASPLCAGLLFGPLAGIISGLIGGIERYVAVYWGVGSYTRLACSISTVLAGVLAAAMRINLFDDKTPNWDQGLVMGIFTEVFHMMMIIVTNSSDVRKAFEYVQLCAIPMILANSISVAVAILCTKALDEKHAFDNAEKKPSLSVKIQKRQIIVVSIAFMLTAYYGYSVQSRIAKEDIDEGLSIALYDAVAEIDNQVSLSLRYATELVAQHIVEEGDEADFKDMMVRYEVSEINVVDKYGIITKSSDPKYIGFDMNSGSQSAEFMQLLDPDGPEYYIQGFRPTTDNPDVYMKYGGVRIPGGFVQCGYDQEQMESEINYMVSGVAQYRHVEENGSLIILDKKYNVISYTVGSDLGWALKSGRVDPEDIIFANEKQEYVTNICTIDDQQYYFMYIVEDNYIVVSLIPKVEGDFSKDFSSYLNWMMQIMVFFALYVAIFIVLKTTIIDNIHEINKSLEMITDGNLDTVVDVKETEEFAMLSDDINETVDTLKRYIDEANERIDTELGYAKDIQMSALPSKFPAFPDRNEFDIYALMDPAKEVGGDFYDFYMIDDNTLVFLVADVSGKGIPASLFMMRAKTTIKTFAENKISPADIFTNANFELCEGNDADMFVTAWIGFLNLSTGELRYANAGHNRPLIKRKGGKYEYLQGPAGFVLAGMEGIAYKEQQTMLEPGDEIFLYTDGVVEATDVDKQLYGDDRLEECINSHLGETSEDICNHVKEDVDRFYEGAPQFDDITELSLKYLKYTDK